MNNTYGIFLNKKTVDKVKEEARLYLEHLHGKDNLDKYNVKIKHEKFLKLTTTQMSFGGLYIFSDRNTEELVFEVEQAERGQVLVRRFYKQMEGDNNGEIQ